MSGQFAYSLLAVYWNKVKQATGILVSINANSPGVMHTRAVRQKKEKSWQ
jgi:hypothetical protein